MQWTTYKLQLGLPMTVPLELDDGPLRPIRQQLGRFEEIYAQVRQVELAAAKYNLADPVAQIPRLVGALFNGFAACEGHAVRHDNRCAARLVGTSEAHRRSGERAIRRNSARSDGSCSRPAPTGS